MTLTWRIHTALLRDSESKQREIRNILSEFNDTFQFVSGSRADLTSSDFNFPNDLTDSELSGFLLSTIQEAKSNVSGLWRHPRISFFHPEMYSVSYWLPRISSTIPVLNRQSIFIPAGCIRYLPHSFPEHVFIRPNSGLKLFTGFVLDCQKEEIRSWEELQQHLQNYYPSIEPESLICFSPAQYLEKTEWRFWIANGKIFASSPYNWENFEVPWREPPSGAVEIAEAMAHNDWQPDVAYVVDVVQTRGGRFWLNEINAVSTSGLYSVKLPEFFSRLREIVLNELHDIV